MQVLESEMHYVPSYPCYSFTQSKSDSNIIWISDHVSQSVRRHSIKSETVKVHIAFLIKQFCQIISETQTKFFLILEGNNGLRSSKSMEVFESQKFM